MRAVDYQRVVYQLMLAPSQVNSLQMLGRL